MSSVLEQFAAERALASRPFPLRYFLHLYVRADRADVYCNYFAGTKLLLEWLAPIDTSEIDSYSKAPLPDMLMSYEIDRLSMLLGVSQYSLARLIWSMYHGNN